MKAVTKNLKLLKATKLSERETFSNKKEIDEDMIQDDITQCLSIGLRDGEIITARRRSFNGALLYMKVQSLRRLYQVTNLVQASIILNATTVNLLSKRDYFFSSKVKDVLQSLKIFNVTVHFLYLDRAYDIIKLSTLFSGTRINFETSHQILKTVFIKNFDEFRDFVCYTILHETTGSFINSNIMFSSLEIKDPLGINVAVKNIQSRKSNIPFRNTSDRIVVVKQFQKFVFTECIRKANRSQFWDLHRRCLGYNFSKELGFLTFYKQVRQN